MAVRMVIYGDRCMTVELCEEGERLLAAWEAALKGVDMEQRMAAMQDYFFHRNGYSNRNKEAVICGCKRCGVRMAENKV